MPPPSWSGSAVPADASAWPAGLRPGSSARCSRSSGKHVPPPPAALPPTRWGVEEIVGELLGDRVHDVASYTASVTQRFASPEVFADFFLTHYGPTHTAAARLDDHGRTALRGDLVRLARETDRGLDGSFVSDWDYLVVTAEKR